MAGKSNSKIRLWVEMGLGKGADVTLSDGQTHYLRDVMRRDVGDTVILFNGRDGEWAATLTALARNGAVATCVDLLRAQTPQTNVRLLFAPIKKPRQDMIVEKATELGVSRLTPVITQHTGNDRMKTERLVATALETAEQCERLSIPVIDAPVALDALLENWPEDQPLVFADEAGGIPALEAFKTLVGQPVTILVGPVGGFADDERARLKAMPQVQTVSLGPHILRAETAVIALLALWQSAQS